MVKYKLSFILFVARTQAEMGHTCRGTINLATANIAVEDSCNFVISNGGAQTYHLKANSEVERQRWITALELAKAKAVRMQPESGERENKYVTGCWRGNTTTHRNVLPPYHVCQAQICICECVK